MNAELGKYDYLQVITFADLQALSRELMQQRQDTPWYRPIRRWGIGVTLGVTMGLAIWIKEGKGGIKNSGGSK